MVENYSKRSRWLDVPFDAGKMGTDDKLLKWIESNPEDGQDVLEILWKISNIFADTAALEENYRIVATKKDDVRSFSCARLL